MTTEHHSKCPPERHHNWEACKGDQRAPQDSGTMDVGTEAEPEADQDLILSQLGHYQAFSYF